jgi:hypothetical protein
MIEPPDRQCVEIACDNDKMVRWDGTRQELEISTYEGDKTTVRLKRRTAIMLAKRMLLSLDVKAHEIWSATTEGHAEDVSGIPWNPGKVFEDDDE